VNHPCNHYQVENGAIRISLAQVKGITSQTLSSIIREREKGPFTSLLDFVMRIEASRPEIENLIKIGALDALGGRGDMLARLPHILLYKHHTHHAGLFSIQDIHSSAEQPNSVSTNAGKTRVNYKQDIRASLLAEREILSLDLSGHPLDFCNLDEGFTRIKDLQFLSSGQQVRVAGSVIRYQTPPTRSGRRVVYIIMEDGTGVVDVTVFQDVQEKFGRVLFRCGWLEIRGKIQRRGPGALSLIADEIKPLRSGTIPA
jgi:error-prone DNA polymerase